MRDFLIDCLRNLKISRGLNQYEDMKAKGDAGAVELQKLVNAMITVCNSYNYIPDDAKKRVISQRILDDPELYNLNASKIWRWLNDVSGKYYNVQPEAESVSNATQLRPETQQLISDFMNRLMTKQTFRSVPSIDSSDVKKIEQEDADRIRPRAESVNIHYTSREDLELNELKRQYALQCTDLYTGSVKPGYPTFQEWLKNLD